MTPEERQAFLAGRAHLRDLYAAHIAEGFAACFASPAFQQVLKETAAEWGCTMKAAMARMAFDQANTMVLERDRVGDPPLPEAWDA